MDTISIHCKNCGAMFYANYRILAEDVLDIVEYAKEGHEVRVTDAATVKATFQRCLCLHQNQADNRQGELCT